MTQNNEYYLQYLEDTMMCNNIINCIKMIDMSLLAIQPFNERKILMNINGILSVENIAINDTKGCLSIIYSNTTDEVIDDDVIRDYYYITKFGTGVV